MKYRLRWRVQEKMRAVWRNTIGFRLALWLDKRFPKWCWAELCTTIGLGYDIQDWRKARETGPSCARDCETFGSCYCGKMVKSEAKAVTA